MPHWQVYSYSAIDRRDAKICVSTSPGQNEPRTKRTLTMRRVGWGLAKHPQSTRIYTTVVHLPAPNPPSGYGGRPLFRLPIFAESSEAGCSFWRKWRGTQRRIIRSIRSQNPLPAARVGALKGNRLCHRQPPGSFGRRGDLLAGAEVASPGKNAPVRKDTSQSYVVASRPGSFGRRGDLLTGLEVAPPGKNSPIRNDIKVWGSFF